MAQHPECSLPSFGQMTNGMSQCHVPVCNYSYFTEDSYRQHMDKVHHNYNLPNRPLPAQPTALSTHHEQSFRLYATPPFSNSTSLRSGSDAFSVPSTVSDNGTDSDSSGVPTPDSSRAPSLEASYRRSPSSSAIRTVPRAQHRIGQGASRGGDNDPKGRKTKKEQDSRLEQKRVTYQQEDLIYFYLGHERVEQSGGNGNGAGLSAKKINVIKFTSALLCKLLHEGYCRALEEGRLEEWKAENRKTAEESLEPSNVAFKGTFLEGAVLDMCQSDNTKSKPCIVHEHPDWRTCRRIHNKRRWRINEGRYLSKLRRQPHLAGRAVTAERHH